MFKLQLSRTSQKTLDKLPPHAVKRIAAHLEEIKSDPYRPRPKADIVPVEGSETLYRLRVGKLRVEYEVCNLEKVIEIVKRRRRTRAASCGASNAPPHEVGTMLC
jgi:mRNA-degrading endonuclease RelE of RelBE toxin-antitoxin system